MLASATEFVVTNLSKYSDICSSSWKSKNPLPVISRFHGYSKRPSTPAKRLAKASSIDPTKWVRGYGVGETLELAKSLQREMPSWFLCFVQQALDAGFQLLGEHFIRESG